MPLFENRSVLRPLVILLLGASALAAVDSLQVTLIGNSRISTYISAMDGDSGVQDARPLDATVIQELTPETITGCLRQSRDIPLWRTFVRLPGERRQRQPENVPGCLEKPMIREDQYVDLGLPSGTLWCLENKFHWSYDEAKVFLRLPSQEQMLELKDKCKWTWDPVRKGYSVKGPNGNELFIKANGYIRRKGEDVSFKGTVGVYWVDMGQSKILPVFFGENDARADFKVDLESWCSILEAKYDI